ncbi:L,D-transpeptidase [Falsirhodobacter xinxiangensis]|uniref:L,D-transpeptidase n=1 Tax=Falsirhodobacter xinxiangensis TaxID=2530049 RepID=UPI0010AAFACA|nr:L,D-transpeptidase [Rhodobacter xinxiangensis]
MKIKALLTATALVALLAGCEQMLEPAPPPGPQFIENAYVAVDDGKYDLPAVPVDQIPPQFRRQVVDYETAEAPGTIVIDPAQKLLYLVQGDGKALRYGISVGREGFDWAGTAIVSRKRPYPTWTPPPEMIERQPSLERWKDGQPGSPSNPLGVRAIYLTTNGVDHGYRIHGTPEWRSIGRNASSGCFRMIHQDIIDLYNRVQPGAKVVVLNPDGTVPTKLRLPPPAPKKAKPAAPKPAEQPVPAATPETLAPATVTETPLPAEEAETPAPEAPATEPPAAESPADPAPAELPPAEAPAPEADTASPPAPVVPAPEAETPGEDVTPN